MFGRKKLTPTAVTPAFNLTRRAPLATPAALITNYEELDTVQLSSDPIVLAALQTMNGQCPGFLADDDTLYCIDRTDLTKHEALALNQLVHTLRDTRSTTIVIRETTRAVFESYTRKRTERSLQADADESSQQVEALLTQAIKNNATDIHLEIRADKTTVYQRVYGQLSTSQTFDRTQGAKMIAAIWQIYVHQQYSDGDVAKDGRFNFDITGQRWLCRASYGYSKVTDQRSLAIRLRDMRHIPPITALGYHDSQLATLRHAGANKGITLIIGAVNSGKSTTQTAIMRERPALEKNLEISDQVEVELDNFVQLQLPIEGTDEVIEENKERLRRISTRHDVDFIAINEIRDQETAAMAASMMLQGTSGIASIHGSGWTDAINRLVSPTDLSVSADILFSESFLSVLVVQSLIGVLCENCKTDTPPDDHWRAYYRQAFGEHIYPGLRFRSSDGCDACHHSGISALTLIAETIPVVESNRHLLKDTTNAAAMRAWMQDTGVLNIHQHAYLKIRDGAIDPLMTQRKIGDFNKGNLYDDWRA